MGWYQGEGGAVWQIDDPMPGSMAEERLAEQIKKGELSRCDPPEGASTEKTSTRTGR